MLVKKSFLVYPSFKLAFSHNLLLFSTVNDPWSNENGLKSATKFGSFVFEC